MPCEPLTHTQKDHKYFVTGIETGSIQNCSIVYKQSVNDIAYPQRLTCLDTYHYTYCAITAYW